MRAFWRLGPTSLKRWLQVVKYYLLTNMPSRHHINRWTDKAIFKNATKLMKYFLCSALCLLIEGHVSNHSRKQKEQQPSSKQADFWRCPEKWSLKQNPCNFDPQQTWWLPRRTQRTKVQRRVEKVHRSWRPSSCESSDWDPVSVFSFTLFLISYSHLRKFIEDDLRSLDPSQEREIYIFRTNAKNTDFMQQIFVPMISVIIGCHKSIEDNAGTNEWELLKHRLRISLY